MSWMEMHGPVYSVSTKANSKSEGLSDTPYVTLTTPADCIIIPIRAWLTGEYPHDRWQIPIGFNMGTAGGTGGTPLTPTPHNQHLQASQVTAAENAGALSAGGLKRFDRGCFNIPQGLGWRWIGDGDLIVPVSTKLEIRLAEETNDATIISAGIEWMELGQ